jgi:[CysO sulfur-carrier protein]-S-L-cysteine hydrolase
VRIRSELLEQIVAQARAEAPNECCGMIATRDGEAVAVHPATNAAASPLRYEIDGAEQLALMSAIEAAGQEIGAIYHSHTRSDPVPSQTDINLAFYPESIYLIVGVKNAEADVRAWWIRHGRYEPAELLVE